MELSLESALSTGGFVGHLSYLLLVISMLMRDITWLRIFVIGSAAVGIAYDGIWLSNPVGVFWEALLLIINIVQIALIWRSNRRARFNAEEQALVDRRLRGLSAGAARALLDLGAWNTLPPGRILTREGQPPARLVYISEGRVDIFVGEEKVAECGPGRFIGEMSLFGDGQASATARVADTARAWQIDRAEIGKLRATDETATAVLEAGIARDMRAKIVSANRARAKTEPLPTS